MGVLDVLDSWGWVSLEEASPGPSEVFGVQVTRTFHSLEVWTGGVLLQPPGRTEAAGILVVVGPFLSSFGLP